MIDGVVTARLVRDDGIELLADGKDWLLTAIDGAAAPEYQIFTEQNATSDGETVTGKQVSARDLQLDATALRVSDNAVLRGQAIAFFNPKHTYQVFLTYLGRTRWLTCELSAAKAPNKRTNLLQTWSALFLATNPYWQSIDDFGQDIAAITPRWGFPYMDNPTYGVLVDVANFARQVIFDYDGDVPAYPTITITADGAVTNPKIVKDGAFVRLIDTLAAGDTVVITTNPRSIRITKNGVNVLNKVDRASNFTAMQMQPGTNAVSYEADYGDNNLHVVIRYNKQYLGV